MPRTARKARNQEVFRQVNERIAEIASNMDDSIETLALVCECGRVGCAEVVEISVRNYARVRDDFVLSLFKTGHEDPDREVVVESWGDYLIVQPAWPTRPDPT